MRTSIGLAHLFGLSVLLVMGAACSEESPPTPDPDASITPDASIAPDAGEPADAGVVLTDGVCGFEGRSCNAGCGVSLSCICAEAEDASRLFAACGASHPCDAPEICGPGIGNQAPFCHASSECQNDADCGAARCLTILDRGVCIDVGPGAEGDACEGSGDCADGRCVLGVCGAECTPGDGSCGAGRRCVEHTIDGLLTDRGACLDDPCDWRSSNDECPADEQCTQGRYDPQSGTWLGRCVPKTNLDCEFVACDPGSRCPVGSAVSCALLCDPFVPGDQTVCPNQQRCLPTYDAAGNVVGGTCDARFETCDPTAPTCRGDSHCYPTATGNFCSGYPAGLATDGERCELNALAAAELCGPGLFCEAAGRERGVCRRICALDGDDCAATEACTTVWAEERFAENGFVAVPRAFGLCRARCTDQSDCDGNTACLPTLGVCVRSTGITCGTGRVGCNPNQVCRSGNCIRTCVVDDLREFGRAHPDCGPNDVCRGEDLTRLVGVCTRPDDDCTLP